MSKHVYPYNNPTHRNQSQSDQHWTEVVNYVHQHNVIQAAKQYKHAQLYAVHHMKSIFKVVYLYSVHVSLLNGNVLPKLSQYMLH